ncbi:MAG TPA: flavodoxin domain-containing protein [Gemmatimonadales bacterium]|nr:flavodoxin domain-containing protein [Gemmatimonadales bacterium]
MSRVLILYGTTDGHTRKIATALGGVLSWEGSRVEVVDAQDVSAEVRPDDYDGVIVAASIHMGGYQRAVTRWVRRHADALNHRPSAFISVCLGVLEPREEAQREVRDIMQRFLDRCDWQPAVTKTVAGALRYTKYGWLKKWIMRRIVAKAGGDIDTTRDYEYTDWDDVRAFARAFAWRIETIHATGAVS